MFVTMAVLNKSPSATSAVPAQNERQSLSDVLQVALVVLPGGHVLHVVPVVAPIAPEYVPRGQAVHVAEDPAPLVDDHFPASQSVQ